MAENITLLRAKQIAPNPLNPRKDVGDIAELRISIVQQGVIEPLIVRPTKDPDKYELVAGERRHAAIAEAIKMKDLDKDFEIPVIVRDLDDDTAVQVMLIENLHRKDLTDFEQAESFKKYLETKQDKDAYDDLADRTGLDARYIRRRVSVLALPQEVLDLWAEGVLSYGHLEQLLRVSENEARAFAKETVDSQRVYSVSSLRNKIDAANCLLSKALFDKKQAGCVNCAKNSSVQKNLFGDDFKMAKVTCMDPTCYHRQTVNYLTDNWAETDMAKQYGTNNFEFTPLDYNSYQGFYGSRECFEKCRACKSYKTILYNDGSVHTERACVFNTACYKTLEAAQKTGMEAPENVSQLGEEIKQEARAEKHGVEFAEIFYKENMERTMASNDHDYKGTVLVAVLAMLRSDSKVLDKLMNEDMPDPDPKTLGYELAMRRKEEFFQRIMAMNDDDLWRMHQRVSAAMVLQSNFSLADRITIGQMFGLELDRDFVMTEDYLKKKTKDELVSMGQEFGIWDSPAGIHAVAQLKHGGYRDLKKSAMIEAFLANDLAGKIPPEIAATKAKLVGGNDVATAE